MTDSTSVQPKSIPVPEPIQEMVRARWSKLPIHAELFAEYARERRIDLQSIPTEAGADLYLAFACFSQFSGAIQTFYQCYSAKIRAIGRHFGDSDFFADEVLQKVSERLFVSTAHHASGIGQYRAQAPLSAWVNTIARRLALRQAKSTRGERLLDEGALADEVSQACDQELILLRAQHRDVVRTAIISSLHQMPKRERRFLQLNLVAGISMDRIGKIYGISQSSVSRKIQRAIRNVISTAKSEVRSKLSVSSDELDSIFRLIQSCIDLTTMQFSEPLGDIPFELGSELSTELPERTPFQA